MRRLVLLVWSGVSLVGCVPDRVSRRDAAQELASAICDRAAACGFVSDMNACLAYQENLACRAIDSVLDLERDCAGDIGDTPALDSCVASIASIACDVKEFPAVCWRALW